MRYGPLALSLQALSNGCSGLQALSNGSLGAGVWYHPSRITPFNFLARNPALQASKPPGFERWIFRGRGWAPACKLAKSPQASEPRNIQPSTIGSAAVASACKLCTENAVQQIMYRKYCTEDAVQEVMNRKCCTKNAVQRIVYRNTVHKILYRKC